MTQQLVDLVTALVALECVVWLAWDDVSVQMVDSLTRRWSLLNRHCHAVCTLNFLDDLGHQFNG